MIKKTFVTACVLSALLGFVFLAGCGKKETVEEKPAASSESSTPAATPIDPAMAASISGTVKFDGAAPKAAVIDMSQDPACKGPNIAENVVVSGGNLANVFIYVKEGLGNRAFDVPKEPVVLDQSGCKYHPHVLGVMAAQTVKIVNSDPTTHNIHPTPKDNREWNESQAPRTAPLEKTFAREEIMLPVKCNQHPWMRMFVNVVKNPFFAVSGPDGKYEIKGLPPGEYTLVFVQEKLGEQTQKVTLAAKDNKTVDVTFKP
jgi:plastocyanin